ncbi:hypothetical protein RirG_203110 [Rhizophagus irregularis DAOM 197198w]|uniref:Uncharacterized protein n=1 Tax=Rhizophagus irregularis (strain DAOM 197198w) TaxID=1432141 RepID=A0A015IUA2_RHIIW|nr:hypothetical protein RirG_203110 [Rhizophagus irregularis DAOM 197198w]
MELVKISGMNSFDPTPKLKSSPIPILFISFNRRDTNCIHCGEEYTKTLFCNNQRYCKKCLSCYLTAIADHNIYLDEYNVMMDLECTKHEIRTKEPQVIQECCRNCLKFSHNDIQIMFGLINFDQKNYSNYLFTMVAQYS